MGSASRLSKRARDITSSAGDESDPEIELGSEDEEVDSESEPEFEMGEEDDDDDEEEDNVDKDDDEDQGEDDDEEEDDDDDEEEDDDNDEEDRLKKLAQQDEEMEKLEKEYLNLRDEEQDILKNLKQHKDDDVLKGQAVTNQMVLWNKNLQFRILLQKAFASSNQLPQQPLRSHFCNSDPAVEEAYSDLVTSAEETINSLVELQEALIEKNPSVAQVTDGSTGAPSNVKEGQSKYIDTESDDGWLKIQNMQSRIASFRNSSIDKWQRKTQVTTGAAGFRGKAFNQNISDQVAAYMRDPSRMIKRMQLRRSNGGIIGAVPDAENTAKGEDASGDGDPECLEDQEFYEQLLKEFLDSSVPSSSDAMFYEHKRQQTKKRKIVDRRASKARKIRYDVHEKILNFMAPQPMKLPPMAPKLFENLFGIKNRKPTNYSSLIMTKKL